MIKKSCRFVKHPPRPAVLPMPRSTAAAQGAYARKKDPRMGVLLLYG